MPDRETTVAILLAHRVCISAEHNPEKGKLHGYCVVCGLPWPCETVQKIHITIDVNGLKALRDLVDNTGWRGNGELSTMGYYCEHCSEYHTDSDKIEHLEDCKWYVANEALKLLEGSDA